VTIDPTLIYIAATVFVLTVLGVLFDYLRQPVIIAHLLAGVVLGPYVLGVFTDPSVLGPVAGLGLVLLLFFIGLKIDLRILATQWRVAVFGTLLQVAASVGIVIGLAQWLDWPLVRAVLMGFVITLSSTPIAMRVLADKQLLNTPLGASTVGILVVQDLLAIPMLIVLGLFEGETPSLSKALLQVSSAGLIVAVIIAAARHPGFRLPLAARLEGSRELQVLAALSMCFGTAVLTGLAELSVVLGGFVAGLLIRLSASLHWVSTALEPFNFALVAAFFVSVGVLIDIEFFFAHVGTVAGLTLLALVLNTVVNALILRILGERLRDSLIAGASLAQLGEFGFVLASLGLSTGVVSTTGYQYVLSVTALSWVVSPVWISLVGKLVPERNGA
jgi:CPA2 family monovalent cation:H+ antiporter-2